MSRTAPPVPGYIHVVLSCHVVILHPTIMYRLRSTSKSCRALSRGKSTSAVTKQVQPSAHAQARVQARIAQIDSERPFSDALIDSYSRKHDYLRISLTERCNLRCEHRYVIEMKYEAKYMPGFYCMPSEGIELSPQGKILTNEEIIRLASLFVRSGVTKIRLTGGEPTVRKGIGEIICECLWRLVMT